MFLNDNNYGYYLILLYRLFYDSYIICAYSIHIIAVSSIAGLVLKYTV